MTDQEIKDMFGVRLADYRKRAGINQAELGARAYLSAQMISDYENGKKAAKITSAIRLAEALDITIDELLGSNPGATIIRPLRTAYDLYCLRETLLRLNNVPGMTAIDETEPQFDENGKPIGYDFVFKFEIRNTEVMQFVADDLHENDIGRYDYSEYLLWKFKQLEKLKSSYLTQADYYDALIEELEEMGEM